MMNRYSWVPAGNEAHVLHTASFPWRSALADGSHSLNEPATLTCRAHARILKSTRFLDGSAVRVFGAFDLSAVLRDGSLAAACDFEALLRAGAFLAAPYFRAGIANLSFEK